MKKLLFCLIVLIALTIGMTVNAADAGSATIVSDDIKAAWGCEFTTTLSLTEIIGMNEAEITVVYDRNAVMVKSISAKTDVVAKDESGKITFKISNINGKEAMDLADITFVASENAAFGTYAYLEVSNQNLTNNLGDITIYHKGDATMDGKINVRDLNAVRQVMLRKMTLTDSQAVYANANEDYSSDGSAKINVRDLNAVRMFMLKKVDTLDNRITLTMQNPDGTSKQITMFPETTPTYYLENGELSMNANTYSAVDFSAITTDTTVSVWIPEKPNAIISPSSETKNVGDIITYTVKLISAEDIAAIGVIPDFDESAYELVSGQWLINGILCDFSSESGDGVIAFDGTLDVNGSVFAFSLKVKTVTDSQVDCQLIVKDETNADIDYELLR